MANNGSEEDDYMSDKFLEQSDSVRPGLVFKQTEKRKYELEEQHKIKNKIARIKPRKVLEEENREQGLQTALGTENKGFALLAKMGYKPGTSLGKNETGRKDPVPISIKLGRGGLGREEFMIQKRSQIMSHKGKLQQRRQQLLAEQKEDFLNHQRNKMTEKQIARDLYNSQKSCQQLDQTLGLEEPPELWFWPEIKQIKSKDSSESSSEEEEEEEFQLEPAEKLEILTEYLRNTHFFCVWCGTSYEDEEDLKNCPGNTSDDH